MKNIFFISFVIICKISFSQDAYIYFDENWKTTTKAHASYYRTWKKINDTTYSIQDHFLSGEKQMDANSTSITPSNLFGKVTRYYKNGSKSSEGMYKDNKKTGAWQWWYEDGKIEETGQFDEEGKSTGTWKGFYNNGKLKYEANLVKGKADGTEKWYFNNGQMSSEELYDHGELKKIRQWTQAGVELKKDLELEISPAYPGGNDELFKFIKEKMQYPKMAKDSDITGKPIVKFQIDTLGNIKNVSIKEGAHPLLDSEAVRVVRLMPRWIPGKFHNCLMQYDYNLPINFSLNNYDYIVTYNNDTIRGEISNWAYMYTTWTFKLKSPNGKKEKYDENDAKVVRYKGGLFKTKPLKSSGRKKELLHVIMKNNNFELCCYDLKNRYFVYQGEDQLEKLKSGNTKGILLQYFNNCAAFNRTLTMEPSHIGRKRLVELADAYYNFKCQNKNDKK